MVAPKKVSKKAYQEFDDERWNAFIELTLCEDLESLTPIQRKAHLVNWYDNEVLNGGHWQYFTNKANFNHPEVIKALQEFGANEQADILSQALARLPQDIPIPDNLEKFLEGYELSNLYDLDDAFNNCEIQLEKYLEKIPRSVCA